MKSLFPPHHYVAAAAVLTVANLAVETLPGQHHLWGAAWQRSGWQAFALMLAWLVVRGNDARKARQAQPAPPQSR